MLPREIQSEIWPDQARYDLPRRQLGALRLLGLAPMAFAVFFAWMPAQQILRFLGEIANGSGSAANWFFIAFLMLFVLAAMMPFGFGLFMLMGRTRLVVARDRIIVTELAGPFRWSRKLRLEHIDRLEFGPGAETPQREIPAVLQVLSGIAAVQKDGKKFPLVIGYPPEWLQPLLGELTDALRQRGTTVPVREASLSRGQAAAPIATEPREEKPPASNILLNDTGWRAELQVPPRGLFQDSYGLLAFGGVWCLIMAGVTFAGVFKHGGGRDLGSVMFLMLFWAMGLTMFLIGLHLGTGRWTLHADRSGLHITRKSALRTREWHWASGDLEDICVGDSGAKVNERTLEQLQVLARTGRRKTGVLTGRAHEELTWVATTLRCRLDLTGDGNLPAEPPRIDASRRRQ